MPACLFQVPYDSGHRGRRMGAGPLHLVDRGACDKAGRGGSPARLHPIESEAAFPTEIGTAFELHRALAASVAAAIREGELPLVLSGNCNSAIGTVSGLQLARPERDVGVIWFDGHGDCNTPETFTADFLDAMGLSTLTGRCWQALTATVPGFKAIEDARLALIGGHGMDDGARAVLNASGIANVLPAEIREKGVAAAVRPVLDRMAAAGVSLVYVHLDVDVLDAAFAPANEFAPEGGLLPADILAVVEAVAERFPIAAAAVASYDPGCDRQDRVLQAAFGFLERVVHLSVVQEDGKGSGG